jgi:hypothetical protein
MPCGTQIAAQCMWGTMAIWGLYRHRLHACKTWQLPSRCAVLSCCAQRQSFGLACMPLSTEVLSAPMTPARPPPMPPYASQQYCSSALRLPAYEGSGAARMLGRAVQRSEDSSNACPTLGPAEHLLARLVNQPAGVAVHVLATCWLRPLPSGLGRSCWPADGNAELSGGSSTAAPTLRHT